MSEDQAAPRPRRRRGRALFSLFLLALFAGAWTALYGFVELSEQEVALISRAGRVVRQLEGPGRQLHLPFPIERRSIVSLAPRAIPAGEVAVVTRDGELFEVSYRGQYRVEEPRTARFGVRSTDAVVAAAVEAVLVELAAQHASEGFKRLGSRNGERAQRSADAWLRERNTGLRLSSLDLELNPPAAIAALDAEIEALRGERQALAEAAQRETEALLSAARIRALEVATRARLERDARVSQASGEAERFRALAAEYRRAPEVVRTRIYLETMEAILRNARVVVAEPGAPLPGPPTHPAAPAPAAVPELSAGSSGGVAAGGTAAAGVASGETP